MLWAAAERASCHLYPKVLLGDGVTRGGWMAQFVTVCPPGGQEALEPPWGDSDL